MQHNTERIRSVEFDFPLPPERIAQRPRPYSEQKLAVFGCDTQQTRHKMFNDLASILRPGDLIVANDSSVVPAALRRDDGVFILIMYPEQQSLKNVIAICPSKPEIGDTIEFDRAKYVV